MKEKSGRRSFIKNVGIGSISAAMFPAGIATILPVSIANASDEVEDNKEQAKQTSQKRKELITLPTKVNT